MTEPERLLQVLESARAEFGRDALRRLEGPILAAAGKQPQAKFEHPYQSPPSLYVPGLKARPWHDKKWAPQAAILESAAPIMRAELDELLATRGGFQPYDEGEEGFTPYNVKGKWNVFYFFLGAKPVAKSAETCPRTFATLESLPNLAQQAMYSALTPGTHLEAHCGPTNTVICLSMGLIAPVGCEMRVADEKRTWKEGECFVFDDSFEHEVHHRGTSTRFIMLLDIWHPELTPVECKVAAQVLWSPGSSETQLEKHVRDLDGKRWW
jgi:hypothetical protein